MKNTCLFLLLLLSTYCYAQSTKVITYNIRYANNHDGDDSWDNRKAKVVDILKTNNPDIIGLQEVLKKQLTYLDKNLDQYNYVGVGRDDGKTKGEYSPIFYKKDKYTLVDKGWFWISETPNKPSKGWDAACKRICTWILLNDINTKTPILVFNTHLDHKGEEARDKGAKLIIDSLKAKAGAIANVFFMGDFNATPGSAPYATLCNNTVLTNAALTDSYTIAGSKTGTVGTTNSFNTTLTDDKIKTRIDYVFCNPAYKKITYTVIGDKVNNHWPSDHMPVMVEVE